MRFRKRRHSDVEPTSDAFPHRRRGRVPQVHSSGCVALFLLRLVRPDVGSLSWDTSQFAPQRTADSPTRLGNNAHLSRKQAAMTCGLSEAGVPGRRDSRSRQNNRQKFTAQNSIKMTSDSGHSVVLEFRERFSQTPVCAVLNPCATFEQGAPVHCSGRHRLKVQLILTRL